MPIGLPLASAVTIWYIVRVGTKFSSASPWRISTWPRLRSRSAGCAGRPVCSADAVLIRMIAARSVSSGANESCAPNQTYRFTRIGSNTSQGRRLTAANPSLKVSISDTV